MAGGPDELMTCAECGASIYPEHVERGLAEHYQGKLLCVHCVRAKRDALEPEGAEIAPPEGEVPIAIVDEDDASGMLGAKGGVAYDTQPTAIRSFGGGPAGRGQGQVISERNLKRSLLKDVPNATRARLFHCKLADGAMAYMCEQINEWADSRDDIQIKFATSCIGVVEGKHADSHLIVTVFY
jgi:hypothetical protein